MGLVAIIKTAGGIGLFLLGMTLMTDGLKTLAGDSLRKTLSRFTGGRFSSFMSGAAITAVIQSSSATSLMTVGFVSAGLITFEQSIGIILGANVGTTATTWMVTFLGFKINMAVVAYPLIALGAFMKVIPGFRSSAAGLIMAGFGMIFVGISLMQESMAGIAGLIDLSSFSAETFSGRILLVALGILMTVVMQSSSAAMATTLVALDSGALSLGQAAAVAIGQNIGTTFITGISAIGSITAARRTALAHIAFNIFCGAAIFVLMPLFVSASIIVSNVLGDGDNLLALSAFHTLFNLAGAAAILPFTGRFAALVKWILPEKGPLFTRNLDPSVLMVPEVALETIRRTLVDIGAYMTRHLLTIFTSLDKTKTKAETALVISTAHDALLETKTFISRVRSFNNSPLLHRRHTNLIHALDHLQQLVGAFRHSDVIEFIVNNPELAEIFRGLTARIELLLKWLDGESAIDPHEIMEKASLSIAGIRKDRRENILQKTAAGDVSPDKAFSILESMRWIDSAVYHIWRAVRRLEDTKEIDMTAEASEVYSAGTVT